MNLSGKYSPLIAARHGACRWSQNVLSKMNEIESRTYVHPYKIFLLLVAFRLFLCVCFTEIIMKRREKKTNEQHQ